MAAFPADKGGISDGEPKINNRNSLSGKGGPGRGTDAPDDNSSRDELLREARRLRTIFFRIPDAVTVIDRNSKITFQNRAATDYFGENLGNSCRDAVKDPEVACRDCPVALCLKDGLARHVHVEHVFAERYVRYMDIDIVPLPGEGPDTREVVLVASDVTSGKAEENRRRDMLSMISHDLKTQLSIVTFNFELFEQSKEQPPGSRETDAAEAIRKAARNTTLLMDDFVAFSGMESGRLKLDTQPFPLDALISYVLNSTKRLSDKVYATVHADIPEELPDVMVDVDRFGRILTNIITNALKHGHSGVNVRIGVRSEGQGRTVRLEIADDGPGIAEKDLPYVFDRYYSSSKKVRDKGHGLGLAIVKKITELHGGSVEINSREGEGTSVVLLLPTAPSTH